MSAKGRGEELGGEHEVYPTPAWCVFRLLDRIGEELQPGLWLEPCAGYGAIVRACAAHRLTAGRILWSAVEIRAEVEQLLMQSLAIAGSLTKPLIGDFLQPSGAILHECTVSITNPPFSIAMRVLQQSMVIAPRAHHAFLLRTNFISGADDRYHWLCDHMPDEYRLADRPIYRGDHADSAEYSWFVWGPGAGQRIRRRGHSELLDPTPLEERKRDLLETQSLLKGVEFKAPQMGLFS